jgi:hypothetical protein
MTKRLKISLHILFLILCLFIIDDLNAANIDKSYWHGIEREIRYKPDGAAFLINNGNKRFTRAIYGTNSDFRFETSDYPEFGLYMPNFGGSIYLAVFCNNTYSWVRNLSQIESRFESGIRTWVVKDKLLFGKGLVTITSVALSNGDGIVLKVDSKNIPEGAKLIWVYGGANDKRFSRSGDIGADPANSFYIEPEKCQGNKFNIDENSFSLIYGKSEKQISGLFPSGSKLRMADGRLIDSLVPLMKSTVSDFPVLISECEISSATFYACIRNPKSSPEMVYSDLCEAFTKGDEFRKSISGRVKVETPDPFLNTIGGILAGAEDAVWHSPSYLHGAIGWRTPLTGWRGAYIADVFGLHDRARSHFDAYAASQLTEVPVSLPPRQDAKVNLARAEKTWGTPMYSNGYICPLPNSTGSMSHYDMNLVYIDELLWHLNWTGDLNYAKKIFPVIKRHLAWEKMVFDADNDGLYDGYCCIWASDGLQYDGGAVTHSSAYNYRANKIAAEIAEKIGEDPAPYNQEAIKILTTINKCLWLPGKGWWAEFKDNMGYKKTHDDAAVWTIYHSIDSDISDPFKSYQATRYVDTEIPHIPVIAKNLDETDNYVVSTTNWQPYMWSINNVAFAEIAHTALAFWQSGRSDEAYKMYKGAILDAMYMGSGPGNITQISFYDAARGETYRDFADPVAMVSRTLVQGLFGIYPDLLNDKLVIRPGFPEKWKYANLDTRNMSFRFKRKGDVDCYKITPELQKKASLTLEINAGKDRIKSLTVNGRQASFKIDENSVSKPKILIDAGYATSYDIRIVWSGKTINDTIPDYDFAYGDDVSIPIPEKIVKIFNPQSLLINTVFRGNSLKGLVNGVKGNRTLFVKVCQGSMTWWKPVRIFVHDKFEIINEAESNSLEFGIKNFTINKFMGSFSINDDTVQNLVDLNPGETGYYSFGDNDVMFGTNKINFKYTRYKNFELKAVNWNLLNPVDVVYDKVNLKPYFNDKVGNIFAYGKYLTPRWPFTTLQVPAQGMGQWSHPEALSNIDDKGLREKAGSLNTFTLPQGIPFETPGDLNSNNVIFTTLWDNYPDSVTFPLAGKSSRAYFMMAASTNHMQSHFLNGTITVNYTDETSEVLELVLPDNLLPLDQDIYTDGFAFTDKEPKPYRINLKTGSVGRFPAKAFGLKMSNDPIVVDGGLATIIDLPLNREKTLSSLTLKTIANEVIIGLMAVTLVR